MMARKSKLYDPATWCDFPRSLGAGSGGFAGLGGYQARPLGSHIPAALWIHRPTRLAILAFVAHGDPYCRIFSLAAFSEIALILLHQMRDTRPDLPPVLE